MRRFIINIVRITSVISVIILIICSIQLKLRQQEFNSVASELNDVEYLFVGDSHVGLSFDFEPNSNCRTLWKSATNPIFSYITLKGLYNSGCLGSVKCVVTEIGYQTFVPEFRDDWLRFHAVRLLPLMGNAWYDLYRFNLLSLHLPFDFIEFKWEGGFDERPQNLRMLSQLSRNEITKDVKSFSARWFTEPDGMEAIHKSTDKVIDVLTQMNRWCKQNGIELIVCSTPLYHELLSEVTPYWRFQLKQVSDALKREEIQYFNFMEMMDETDFRDSSHLTKDAARRFTHIFMSLIREE